MAEIQRWAGESLDVITLSPPLSPGDAVEIIDGPLQGLHAVVRHGTEDRERVAVLLSLLDSRTTMINRSQLRRRAGS